MTVIKGFSHELHTDQQGLWLDITLEIEDKENQYASFFIPVPSGSHLNKGVYTAVVNMTSGTNPDLLGENVIGCPLDELVSNNIELRGRIEALDEELRKTRDLFAKRSSEIYRQIEGSVLES